MAPAPPSHSRPPRALSSLSPLLTAHPTPRRRRSLLSATTPLAAAAAAASTAAALEAPAGCSCMVGFCPALCKTIRQESSTSSPGKTRWPAISSPDLIKFGAVYYALVAPQPPPYAAPEHVRIFREVTEPSVLRRRASIKGKTVREAQKTFRVD
ncbi:hypothetical protein ACP4OV_028340 [Aristida adscensionis]